MTIRERCNEHRGKAQKNAEMGKKCYDREDYPTAARNYYMAYVEMKYANNYLLSMVKDDSKEDGLKPTDDMP